MRETESQARKNIGEALFFSCDPALNVERGCHLKAVSLLSTSDPIPETDEEQIDIPLYLLAEFVESRHCHA